MQYIIMFLIVVGLALADFLTGYIKARCQDNVQSKQMRIGGLHKFAELVVMGTAIGLDIGMRYLGKYFQSQQLADITGAITAIGVFGYITVMEIISPHIYLASPLGANDSIDYATSQVAIPTVDGANNLICDTTVQPSKANLIYTGWHSDLDDINSRLAAIEQAIANGGA